MSSGPSLPFQRRDLPAGVGRALREARVSASRTRRDVAVAVGIATRTLARIEREAQKPTWRTLDRLCDELGTSVITLARRWTVQSLDLPTSPVSAPGLGLRALRREREMTLVRLAELTGVSAATISRFERGITASRRLGRRIGAAEVAFYDRDVVLDGELLAPAFGFADTSAFERACLSAFAASAGT